MRRHQSLSFIAAALLTVSGLALAAEHATHFTASGDISVTVDDATATMIRIRNKIPALNIITSPASNKKLGGSYSVNLFFSNKFNPKPGIFPVEFSYRSKPDTLGGSFLAPGVMFSHDTKGTAEFLEFGDRVRVRFEFQVFDKSEDREGRRAVTIKGEASCETADIF
jgi:hypothetical protein